MFIILDTNFCCSYYYYIAIAPTKKKNYYYFNLLWFENFNLIDCNGSDCYSFTERIGCLNGWGKENMGEGIGCVWKPEETKQTVKGSHGVYVGLGSASIAIILRRTGGGRVRVYVRVQAPRIWVSAMGEAHHTYVGIQRWRKSETGGN